MDITCHSFTAQPCPDMPGNTRFAIEKPAYVAEMAIIRAPASRME